MEVIDVNLMFFKPLSLYIIPFAFALSQALVDDGEDFLSTNEETGVDVLKLFQSPGYLLCMAAVTQGFGGLFDVHVFGVRIEYSYEFPPHAPEPPETFRVKKVIAHGHQKARPREILRCEHRASTPLLPLIVPHYGYVVMFIQPPLFDEGLHRLGLEARDHHEIWNANFSKGGKAPLQKSLSQHPSQDFWGILVPAKPGATTSR